jgi:hypothetical protein
MKSKEAAKIENQNTLLKSAFLKQNRKLQVSIVSAKKMKLKKKSILTRQYEPVGCSARKRYPKKYLAAE